MADQVTRSPRERLARLWHRIPAIRFGREGQSSVARESSPVTSYYLVIIPAVLLALIGLLMGFSASAVTNIAQGENPYIAFLKPLALTTIGLIMMFVAQMVPEKVYYAGALVLFAVACLLQALVMVPLFGRAEGGNTNWIHIPGLPFLIQPSELLKLALIIALAQLVARRDSRRDDFKQMAIRCGGATAAALGLVMLGHDMGTALVVATCAFGALWVAGLPRKWFGYAILAAIPILAFLVVQNPTRLRRIIAIIPGMGPERSTSAPEQIDHALWAFGSGGLMGLGPGASREKWEYLQAAHTDFILAIVGEEFGLLGTCSVLVLMMLMVWGMVRVSRESTSLFAAVVSGGIASWIAVQTIINVMSVTGMGPVIGVPLPLVSSGGSAFVFTASAVGVVASCARANAHMRMFGSPDEASAGRDPRRRIHKRPARTRRVRQAQKAR